jgi:hypothetical protein
VDAEGAYNLLTICTPFITLLSVSDVGLSTPDLDPHSVHSIHEFAVEVRQCLTIPVSHNFLLEYPVVFALCLCSYSYCIIKSRRLRGDVGNGAPGCIAPQHRDAISVATLAGRDLHHAAHRA